MEFRDYIYFCLFFDFDFRRREIRFVKRDEFFEILQIFIDIYGQV